MIETKFLYWSIDKGAYEGERFQQIIFVNRQISQHAGTTFLEQQTTISASFPLNELFCQQGRTLAIACRKHVFNS
jgi:hypothetical protein